LIEFLEQKKYKPVKHQGVTHVGGFVFDVHFLSKRDRVFELPDHIVEPFGSSMGSISNATTVDFLYIAAMMPSTEELYYYILYKFIF
jgi:hypothetical protein